VLVAPHDVERLAEALQNLIASSKMRQTLHEKGLAMLHGSRGSGQPGKPYACIKPLLSSQSDKLVQERS